MKLKLSMNVNLGLNLAIQFQFFTPVLLPNLNHIFEPVLIPMSVIFKLESPIFQNHIMLMENEYEPEFQFLDLDPILEPISTP